MMRRFYKKIAFFTVNTKKIQRRVFLNLYFFAGKYYFIYKNYTTTDAK